MRIRVACDGKIKDAHLRALEIDYRHRIAHFAEIIVEEGQSSRGKTRGYARRSSSSGRGSDGVPGSCRVLLDRRGTQWSSHEFSEWLGKQQLRGTRELVFEVGGPDGFSEAEVQQADRLLALSRMTLTHDWARVLLLEQIYRAFAILRGFPYAR